MSLHFPLFGPINDCSKGTVFYSATEEAAMPLLGARDNFSFELSQMQKELQNSESHKPHTSNNPTICPYDVKIPTMYLR
jgi:hypothetical protein